MAASKVKTTVEVVSITLPDGGQSITARRTHDPVTNNDRWVIDAGTPTLAAISAETLDERDQKAKVILDALAERNKGNKDAAEKFNKAIAALLPEPVAPSQ